jgi:A/G-specific adenine glycosylase
MLLMVDGDQVLLEQRPPSGIWGGLLSLPELDGHVAAEDDEVEPADHDALLRVASLARWNRTNACRR